MIDIAFYIFLFIALGFIGWILLKIIESPDSTLRVYKRLDKPGYKVSGPHWDAHYYDTEKEARSFADFWNKEFEKQNDEERSENWEKLDD